MASIFSRDELTALAVRMKKGDRKAAGRLFEDLFPKAYGFFMTRVSHRETAEDLTQDIFLKLAGKIDGFDESRGGFTVWFWQMARNMLIDFYRSRKETPFSSMSDDVVEGLSVGNMPNVDDKLQFEKIRNFLKTLSEEEQELFELRYVAEMPYRDLAHVVGKTEGALRVAMLRMKEKIKREFKLEDHEI